MSSRCEPLGRLYERGYRKWEKFAIDEEEAIGFREVSLYRDGRLVPTKSPAPKKGSEVKHE